MATMSTNLNFAGWVRTIKLFIEFSNRLSLIRELKVPTDWLISAIDRELNIVLVFLLLSFDSAVFQIMRAELSLGKAGGSGNFSADIKASPFVPATDLVIEKIF